ncbi:hypothetical protein [Streptomyces sp. NPDC057939]|uniref:hypothetical protein n=1 Tax=Streptomyces sp. NPDC057939 TaxID=3346284 RepID=UPI0036EBA1CF
MFGFEKVGPEEAARQEALATDVRNELVAAGLPLLAPGLQPVLAGGAYVDVDPGADAAGGVYVRWLTSPRLRECALRAHRLLQPCDDVPAVRHCDAVEVAMMGAMTAILTSAGCTVEDPRDEYRPNSLRVLDGPGRAVWALRAEEVALPGTLPAEPPDGSDRPRGTGRGTGP